MREWRGQSGVASGGAARKAKSAVCACALLLIASAAVAAVPGATAKKYAAVVLDSDTGVVLYESNADFTRYPASLTKMMTLYLAFDALKSGKIKLTTLLPVSEHAASRDPSRLGLTPGSKLALDDAIQAMTTKSANDAACVVAEALANGSEARFAEMMTAKAQALGMKHTSFRNASGLPEGGHLSSAMDIAILARALVRDFPEHYHFFSVSHFDWGGKSYPSQNRFLRTYPGADGLKTGYIDSSGHNLAASAVRGGKRLIAVVLGGDTQRWTREYASQLLDIAYGEIDPKLLVVASVPATPAATAAAPVAAAKTAPVAAAAGATVAAARTVSAAVVAATTVPAAVASAPAAPATLPPAPMATAPATTASATKAPTSTATASAATATATAAGRTPGAAASATTTAKAAATAPPANNSTAAASTSATTATAIATNNIQASVPSPAHSSSTDALLASAQPSADQRQQPDSGKSEASLRAHAWSVQVGLYNNREDARKRGQEARDYVPNYLGKAPLMLAGYGSNVSPRFGGLTETDARQTCTQLQRKKLPCVVVPPGRALVIATN